MTSYKNINNKTKELTQYDVQFDDNKHTSKEQNSRK